MTTPPNRHEDEKREYMRYSIFQACAIDDIEVSAEYLRVLAALGSYASKRNDYWCWTGLDKIAKRLGVTKQAVSKAVIKLSGLGYIELRHDYDHTGKQISNAYRIVMDYVLPPERDRANFERRRAGVGGQTKSRSKARVGSTQSVDVGSTQSVDVGSTQSVDHRVNSRVDGGSTQSVDQIWESESEKINREVQPAPIVVFETKTETAEAEAEPPTPLPPAHTPQQRFAEWLKRERYTAVPGQSGVPVEKRIYEDAYFRRFTHLEVTAMFLASQREAPVAVRATHTRRVRGA